MNEWSIIYFNNQNLIWPFLLIIMNILTIIRCFLLICSIKNCKQPYLIDLFVIYPWGILTQETLSYLNDVCTNNIFTIIFCILLSSILQNQIVLGMNNFRLKCTRTQTEWCLYQCVYSIKILSVLFCDLAIVILYHLFE